MTSGVVARQETYVVAPALHRASKRMFRCRAPGVEEVSPAQMGQRIPAARASSADYALLATPSVASPPVRIGLRGVERCASQSAPSTACASSVSVTPSAWQSARTVDQEGVVVPSSILESVPAVMLASCARASWVMPRAPLRPLIAAASAGSGAGVPGICGPSQLAGAPVQALRS